MGVFFNDEFKASVWLMQELVVFHFIFAYKLDATYKLDIPPLLSLAPHSRSSARALTRHSSRAWSRYPG